MDKQINQGGSIPGDALPPPLTPPDCDLRGLEFMPLEVGRLRDSELAALETPESCWAAVLLWCASWHQVPAASLPDDDRVLSNFAGYGRVVKEWARIKDGALRGWIKCSDNRLYHPVVAEKAIESWSRRLHYEYGKIADRTRKENKARSAKGQQTIVIPDFTAWNSTGRPPEFRELSDGNPPVSDGNPEETPPVSAGKTDSSAGNPPENALIGIGIGIGIGTRLEKQQQRTGEGTTETATATEKPAAALPDPVSFRAIELASLLAKRGAALQASDPRVRRWAETGVSDGQALTALETANRRRDDRADPKPVNAGLLDAILGDMTATPRPMPNGRKPSIHAERAATIAAMTGKSTMNIMIGEYDVTADSIRLA